MISRKKFVRASASAKNGRGWKDPLHCGALEISQGSTSHGTFDTVSKTSSHFLSILRRMARHPLLDHFSSMTVYLTIGLAIRVDDYRRFGLAIE
jgi:hypothetical protein